MEQKSPLLSRQRKCKVEAAVNLQNLIYNYNSIQKHVHGSRICCVVKADAYGHGAWECVRVLADNGADYFAVSSVEEAEEVRLALEDRKNPIDILVLGYTLPEDADLLIRYRISQTVFSEDYAAALAHAVEQYKQDGTIPPDAVLSIHIKVDTGMNRLGFRAEDTEAMRRTCAIPCFSADGIFTHFAKADEPSSPMTEEQFSRFQKALDTLEKQGVTFPLRHACNSAAITDFPHMQLDMVRFGIELYGLKPSAETIMPDVRPVMTLRTVISHIHTVRKGEHIGYGAAFTAPRDMQIATLPIGYADGYIRAYGVGGTALIHGKAVPVCGRVCMDQCMVDVSEVPSVQTGDEVILFGDGDLTADDVAKQAGTIGYEVLCLIGRRVPRVYVK